MDRETVGLGSSVVAEDVGGIVSDHPDDVRSAEVPKNA